ncbi:MAG: potassium-transporting ATPase subunit KdpC [Opitutaceae bacterium]|nr:potassium-transporting ATPase subunit KdpC [Opitutaceae bacterium]
MNLLVTSLRLVLATLLMCSVAYPALFLALGHLVFPESARGHLVRSSEGTVIGSRLVAQSFTSDGYFWPRPSAVDYHADAAGGSNLAPTNPELAVRTADLVRRLGATADRPLPAELATASGSGLDPHISLAGALFQIDRVAAARQVDAARVRTLVEKLAFQPGGPLAPDPIVNVLELNLALDQACSAP